MISLEFDDLIYKLQRFGGASSYWTEITTRVSRDRRFTVKRSCPSALRRGLPCHTSAQVFHSSHFRVPVLRRRSKVISTVHDMNYELGYVVPSLGAKLNIAERRRSYFTADGLICISTSTRDELLQVYPELRHRCPIRVIHHGLTRLPPGEVQPGAVPSGPGYVLYVGGRQSYKRFEDALQGFWQSGLAAEGYKLLCTGQKFSELEQARIDSFGLPGTVLAVGNISESHLAALYENAHCLVYPSIHEGFGLPLVEAMASSCPVICCDTSCMPEIAGNAALLVPPQSPEAIAQALLTLLVPDVRALHVASGLARADTFSWATSAAKHMELYVEAQAL